MAVGRYGSAEAVVLPLNGVLAMFQQQQQERRLLQQQLDKQVNEDLSKLSFDGVRPNDYPIIRQKYDAYKDAAIRYKKSLRDPKTRDQAERDYINSKSDLNAFIGQSKSAKEQKKGIIEFWGKNRENIDPTEFAKINSLLDAPVGSPEYEQAKNIDISNLVFKPEKYDPKKIGDLIATIKPVETKTATPLANGQISYVNKKIVPPTAISTIIGNAYDNDYENTKKYYDAQFSILPEEDKSIYETYAAQYIPGFKIETPKDLAIAQNMYGRVDQGIEQGVKGTDRSRIERFAREQQSRQIAAADARQARALATRASAKSDGYYVVNDIAAGMKSGNVKGALAPFESYASPGTVVTFLKRGQVDEGMLDRVYEDVKRDGVDAKTRMIPKSAFKNGTLIVAVPKIDPKTKETLKGYEYMAVPASEKNLQSRINAMLNYARGGAIKPLPDKFFKGKILTQEPDVIYTPGTLDDADENEQ